MSNKSILVTFFWSYAQPKIFLWFCFHKILKFHYLYFLIISNTANLQPKPFVKIRFCTGNFNQVLIIMKMEDFMDISLFILFVFSSYPWI